MTDVLSGAEAVDLNDPAVQEQRQQAMLANMQADGVAGDEPVQEDYFSVEDVTYKSYCFPDGVTYIEFKKLSHGDRRDYLNKTNRGVSMNRGTGDMKFETKAGDDRDTLLKMAVCGWNMLREGAPVPFSKAVFEQWLPKANPDWTDELEKDIRRENPWLLADMTIEDMEKERDRLNELIDTKRREEEGKES